MKNLSFWNFFLLCLFLTASQTVFSAGGTIPDVKEDHWAKESIDKMVTRGVIKLEPDGKFSGKKSMSRYDMAVVLSRALQEIDEGEAGHQKVTEQEVGELKKLLLMISEEISTVRNKAETVEKDHGKIVKQNELLDEKLIDLGERIGNLEKSKSSISFAGEYRVRYQHTALDAKGITGSTSANQSRFRLAMTGVLDPTMYAFARFKVTEPVGRRSEKATEFELDQVYLDKKELARADWRLGRQFHKQGNGMIFMNYFDGLLVKKDVKHNVLINASILAEHRGDSVSKNKSHGHNANFLSVQYEPKPEHSLILSSFVNNANEDKYGVYGETTPKTKEGWVSLDFKGRPHNKLEYYGTLAAYRNQLDENNTKPTERHLRGDIDNAGYMVGADYYWTKKFKFGALWAMHEDNFRAFSILADRYYGMTTLYSPLEDSFTALGLLANLPGNAAEGIYPPNDASAAPATTPRGKIGDNRPTWSNLQDIHGYKDLQVTGHYYFNRRLSLRLSGAWMTPAKSRYNYRSVTSYMSRLNYQYDGRVNVELRGMHVTSDFDRSMNDIRTEILVKF